MQKMKVSVRDGFSDRNNIKPENKEMQLYSLDSRTRTAIVNAINLMYNIAFPEYDDRRQRLFLNKILSEVYNQQVDYSQYTTYNQAKMLKIISTTIMEDDYDDVLTLIEQIVKMLTDMFEGSRELFITIINSTFTKEYVGYRYIGQMIVPITDQNETDTVEEALNIPIKYIQSHIEKAAELLSDRSNPDFENSIKESITAVEAMCNVLTGRNDTLGASLKTLRKNGFPIHGAIVDSFEKIYGYSCDATGIRHAGKMEGPKATFDEAKFIFIACSAFVNYLKSLASAKL